MRNEKVYTGSLKQSFQKVWLWLERGRIIIREQSHTHKHVCTHTQMHMCIHWGKSRVRFYGPEVSIIGRERSLKNNITLRIQNKKQNKYLLREKEPQIWQISSQNPEKKCFLKIYTWYTFITLFFLTISFGYILWLSFCMTKIISYHFLYK